MIGDQRLRTGAALFGPVLLAVCAGPATTEVRWVKAGVDDAAAQRELSDCNSQANAALTNERGINQDINATLGGNWQFSGTSAIEHQAIRAQEAGYSRQFVKCCMAPTA